RPEPRAPLRRRRARRRRPRGRDGGEAGASAQRPRLDCHLPLLAGGPRAPRPLPRRGESARSARTLPRLACRTGPCLRVPLLRIVARHPNPRTAPRGGQPLPGTRRAPKAGVVLTVEKASHNRWGHVTLFVLVWTAWLFELVVPSRCVSCGEPGLLF